MIEPSNNKRGVKGRLLLFHVSYIEHGGKLEKDIMGDTSGHYQRLLIMLLQVKGKCAVVYIGGGTPWTKLGLNGNNKSSFMSVLSPGLFLYMRS